MNIFIINDIEYEVIAHLDGDEIALCEYNGDPFYVIYRYQTIELGGIYHNLVFVDQNRYYFS